MAASKATIDQHRHAGGFGAVVASLGTWWYRDVTSTVAQAAVIASRREECLLSARYLLMITMSAGIAILGLLLSSPAVVIGAMLLSPLMGPIMGLGFAIAIGDFNWMKMSARSLAIGTVFSILFCAAVVFLSPLQTVTSEIAARTRPNLFDLLVALFSAVAGAYAMIRGREGTIVGVAIATALMPPLAVVGFGLATWNWTVFSGALLLFVTNLMTIAITAAAMARLYGFRTSLSEKQTQFQTFLIIAAFVALAVPLGISLRQIAWEANATRQINSVVMEAFDGRARLSQIESNLQTEPIQVAATVLTPQINPHAERITARAMSRALGSPVEVVLTQYRVGTGAQDAEQAQLSAALAAERADLERADELAERLALVAGVSEDEVTVDRERLRATVNARPLEGATLFAYADLERRVLAAAPDWHIRLIPPVRALPQVTFGGETVDDAGQRALDVIRWAQLRVNLPLVLTGPPDALARVGEILAAQSIPYAEEPSGRGFGTVTVAWASPGSKERR